MAQSIFNLYSSSVFADHPLALWNLDDDYSFVGLTAPWPSSQSNQSLYQEDSLTVTNGQKYGLTNKNSIVWITRDGKFSQTQNIFTIAYGNGIWVAAGTNEGSSGSRRSTDAVTWTTINVNFGSSIFSVAYGNGTWALAGQQSIDLTTIRNSTDSITWVTNPTLFDVGFQWTTVTSNFNLNNINSVAIYGSYRYVAVGENGYVATSDFGSNWTSRTSNFGNRHINYVSYNSYGLWIFGDAGQIRQSNNNGVSWITVTSNFANKAINSAYFSDNTGIYIIVGDSGEMHTSNDVGSSWTTQTSNFGTSNIRSIYYNDIWVAVGDGGSIRTSTDTSSWTTRASNFGNNNIRSVMYENNLWVAAGDSGQIRTSTNAIVWTTRTSNFDSININSLSYNNSLWIAVGDNGQVRKSTNAISWITENSSFGTTKINSIFSIVNLGSDYWIAGGNSGQLRISNGIEYAEVSSLAYGNGLWVGAGTTPTGGNIYSGFLITSTDTLSWISRNIHMNGSIDYFQSVSKISYNNDLWLIGGKYGSIRVSTDTINWVTRTSNFIQDGNNRVVSITYGNNIWLLTSNSGEIQTSTNTISWVTRKILNNSSIFAGSAAYGNGKWVISAADGIVARTFSSTDSITWQTTSGINQAFGPIAYGNNFWVAFSDNFYQSFSGEDLTIKTKPAETVGTSDSDFYFSTFSIAEPEAIIEALPYDQTFIDNTKDSININVFTYDYNGSVDSYELGIEHYVTWVTINPNSSVSGVYDIAYGNGIWLAGGGSFNNQTYKYGSSSGPLSEMTGSTNGINWTTRAQAGIPRTLWRENNDRIIFENIAYGNGIWAAQGKSLYDGNMPYFANRLYKSTDTISWTRILNPFLDDTVESGIYALEYYNNTWIAGGDSLQSGALLLSTDLISWVSTNPNIYFNPGGRGIRSIGYNNNTWVIVGGYNTIRTSTNAINWVTRNSNLGTSYSKDFTKVLYGNGLWVATGTDDSQFKVILISSTDSISWVSINFNPNSAFFNNLAYGNGLWVMGTQDGGIYTSTNTINWTTRTSNFGNNSIRTIQYGNGLWIAGGTSGQIRYSTDTVSWVTANSHFGRTHYTQSFYDYKTISSSLADEWQQNTYVATSEPFEITSGMVDVVSAPYLKVVPSENVNATIISLYNFTAGQWSEQYNVESSGARTVPMMDTNIIQSVSAAYSSSTSIFKTVEIDAYSLSDQDNGYYIVENNKPIAINSKLPMVYGSGNITEIYPSSYGTPSIILPGKGFLHGSGKYRELTLEFWMKVNVSTKTPTKIVGPVSSDDGLYVHDGFITLNIGPNQKSYFISHWYRPCLIDITYNQRFATLMINGQTVIEMEIDVNQMNFPEITSFNNDWIGFYATESTQPFEIDCVAIYPYIVPEQLAKRRFVFGQGVGKSEDIVSRFGGSLTNIDFAFSNYTNNIKYPDITQWSGGFYSNVNADSKFLSLPQYNLPEINYSGSNTSIFSNGSSVLKDNIDLQNINYPVKHISLKPTSTYSNVYGSINFSSINILNEPARSIYGVFSINSSELSSADADPNISELTIMYFKNHSTGDVFKIYIDLVTNKLVYKFNTTLIEEFTLSITSNDLFFVAGIDMDTISTQYAAIVKKFFYNPKNITLSIGGYETNMFTGKIYKLTVNNDFFTRMDMDNWFNSNGLASLSNSASTTFNSDITKYIGNYSLLFKKASSSMIMDIGSRGYWEDSIPLTFFASYVKDINGNNSVYKLDLMQFNIDYPSNIYSNNSINTDNDFIKSFITLKTYEDVGNVLYSNYTITKDLGSERVVDFENIQTNIDITKFNVIDGTVIFAPKNIINFEDAYVTVHIELTSNGTSTEPLVLKEMSIASLAYDQVGLHPINTFNGNKIYPFSREGVIYTNQLKNPIAIDKYSMPYLFLTGDSGIQALPYSEVDNPSNLDYSRGLTIPINPNSLSEYSLYGFNLWICYKKDSLFEETLKFLTIKSNNLLLNFYLNYSDNGKRATVSVKSKNVSTYQNYENVSFYQDGIELDTPYLRPMSWTMLTFRFPTPITFNDYIGQLEINPGVLVNNVSLYSQDIDKKVDDIFETHLGLSNIVVQDQSTLVINSDSLSLYTDILWTNYIGKPV